MSVKCNRAEVINSDTALTVDSLTNKTLPYISNDLGHEMTVYFTPNSRVLYFAKKIKPNFVPLSYFFCIKPLFFMTIKLTFKPLVQNNKKRCDVFSIFSHYRKK